MRALSSAKKRLFRGELRAKCTYAGAEHAHYTVLYRTVRTVIGWPGTLSSLTRGTTVTRVDQQADGRKTSEAYLDMRRGKQQVAVATEARTADAPPAPVEPPSPPVHKTVARACPPYWPKPTLPIAAATLLPEIAPQWAIAATEAAEQAAWKQATQVAEARTPTKKAGKRKAKDVEREKAERDRANLAGELCKCKKVRMQRARRGWSAHAPASYV